MPYGWASIAEVAIPAIANLASGMMSSGASKKSSDAQAKAAERGQDVTRGMFEETRQSLSPWVGTGSSANSMLAYMLGIGPAPEGAPPGISSGMLTKPYTGDSLFADPSYQFRLNTGLDAVKNATSVSGGLGGNALKAINDYAQGSASTEYQSGFERYMAYLNNLFGQFNTVSGTGVNAAGGVAGLGANAAGNIANLGLQGANARAAGIVGSTNALTGAGSNLANNYLLANATRNNPGGGGGGDTGTYYTEMPQTTDEYAFANL